MRLIRYINEIDATDQKVLRGTILPLLQKNCSQYINEAKQSTEKSYTGARYVLARYTKTPVEVYTKLTPRVDREPKDTPLWLHTYLDKLFKKKYGWKPRSEGVFAYNIPANALYNSYKLLFPFDGYTYLWNNNVTDLYVILRDYIQDELNVGFGHLDLLSKAAGMAAADVLKDKIDDIINGYHTTNIGWIRDGMEISIHCSAYYLVNIKYAEELYIDGLVF
jgi:hypothetical protein